MMVTTQVLQFQFLLILSPLSPSFCQKLKGQKKRVLFKGKLNGSDEALAYARTREEMVTMVTVLSLNKLQKTRW